MDSQPAGRWDAIRDAGRAALLAPLAPFLFLILLAVPRLRPPMRIVEAWGGEGARHRRRRQTMEEGRRGMDDEAFLREAGVEGRDADIWLALRRAMAESIRVRPDAIRPSDRLEDLWRMRWMGPDLLDLVFRVEWRLGVKIPLSQAATDLEVIRRRGGGAFRDLARILAVVARSARDAS